MGYGINEFIESIPAKYDSNKKISLYESIKKYNPELIKNLNKKLYIKNNIWEIHKEKKWYNSVIEYLLQTHVISLIENDDGIYHKIDDKYKKYFLNSESLVYHTENYNKHLILYKEAAYTFLENTALIKKEEKKRTEKREIPDNWKAIIQKIGGGFIIISMIIFLNFFSKFGINDGIIILLNSIMFIAGVLLNSKL